MKKLIPLALLALAACNTEPTVIGPDDSDQTSPEVAAALANEQIELPPPVSATVTYRCNDNSVVLVDFFQGEMIANLRPTEGADPIRLSRDTAESAESAYAGNDYSMTGDPQRITLATPDGEDLTCRGNEG